MTEQELLEISEARIPLAIKRLSGQYLSREETLLLEELDNKLNSYHDSVRPLNPRENELRDLLELLSTRI